MTEADEDTAIANAEAFCRTLEAIARTLPKVALATHPALGTGAVGGAAVAPGVVGDHLRAARAFEAVVAGDTGTDRPATTTWYSAGKRHLHQPQLESLAELIAPLMSSSSKTAIKQQTTFRDDADADARGEADPRADDWYLPRPRQRDNAFDEVLQSRGHLRRNGLRES